MVNRLKSISAAAGMERLIIMLLMAVGACKKNKIEEPEIVQETPAPPTPPSSQKIDSASTSVKVADKSGTVYPNVYGENVYIRPISTEMTLKKSNSALSINKAGSGSILRPLRRGHGIQRSAS